MDPITSSINTFDILPRLKIVGFLIFFS